MPRQTNEDWAEEESAQVAATFGFRLTEALISSGMSRKDLADAVGVGVNMISHWVSGRRMPSSSRLVRIAQALKADPAYLLGVDTVHLASARVPTELVRLLAKEGKTEKDYEVLGEIHLRLARHAWDSAARIRYARSLMG